MKKRFFFDCVEGLRDYNGVVVALGMGFLTLMHPMLDSKDVLREGDGSVTRWLGRAKAGDANAFTDLSIRYFEQLMEVAKAKFGDASRTVADEEDIANSVLDTLFRNASNGKFPDLHDRNDLWGLLLTITNHKVLSQKRLNARMKRGGGSVKPMTDYAGKIRYDEMWRESEPTHETLTVLADLCCTLLSRIPDPTNRRIAIYKLRGMSNREIARKLGLIPRTVDRKVNLIREKWLNDFELPNDDSDGQEIA